MDPFQRGSQSYSRLTDSDFSNSRYEWTNSDHTSISNMATIDDEDSGESQGTIKLFGQSLPIEKPSRSQEGFNTRFPTDPAEEIPLRLSPFSKPSSMKPESTTSYQPWQNQAAYAGSMASRDAWQQSPPSHSPGSLSLPMMESMNARLGGNTVDLQRIQTWPLDYDQAYLHAAVAQSRVPPQASPALGTSSVPFPAPYVRPDLSASLIPRFQGMNPLEHNLSGLGGEASKFHDFLGAERCATDLNINEVHSRSSPGPSSDSQGHDLASSGRIDEKGTYREDDDPDLRKFPNREDVRAKMDPKILKRRMQGRLRQARYAQRKKLQALQLLAARNGGTEQSVAGQQGEGSKAGLDSQSKSSHESQGPGH